MLSVRNVNCKTTPSLRKLVCLKSLHNQPLNIMLMMIQPMTFKKTNLRRTKTTEKGKHLICTNEREAFADELKEDLKPKK